VLAAFLGAASGRVLSGLFEQQLGRMRVTQDRVSRWLVANSRPLAEAAGALSAVALLSRATTAPLLELHQRSVRVGFLGALCGHALCRVAVFDSDVALARPAAAPPDGTAS